MPRASNAYSVAQVVKTKPNQSAAAMVAPRAAVLLEAAGLPREAFSPTFAVGRVAGWCAHYLEQRATGRLIRPASRYTGPAPAR